jgi:hypothetical protein
MKETEFKRKTGRTSTFTHAASRATIPIDVTETQTVTVPEVDSTLVADSLKSQLLDSKIEKTTQTAITNQVTRNQSEFWDRSKYLLYNLPSVLGAMPNVNSGINMTATFVNVLARGAEFIAEPWEGIPNQKSINWVKVLETIDDLFNPTEHSLLKNAGYTKPTSSLETTADKIGYSMKYLFQGTPLSEEQITRAIADHEQQYQLDLDDEKRAELRKKIIKDNFNLDLAQIDDERRKDLITLQSEMNERPMVTDLTKIPVYKHVIRGLDAIKDEKPSYFLSKAFAGIVDASESVKQFVGPTKTGNPALDYLVNGTQELVASIAASIVMGKGMGKIAGIGGKASFLQRYPAAAKAYEKAAQLGIAAVQTSGESLMEGHSAANTYKEERLFQIGGDELMQRIDERIKKNTQDEAEQHPAMYKYGATDAVKRIIEKVAKEQVFNEYMAENPEIRAEIDKGMAKAFEVTVKSNSLNILFNWFSSGLYLRGKFPTRNILKNPERIGLTGVDAWKGGINEFIEESINTISNKAGVAAAKGEYYDLGSNMLAIDVLESGMWGFLGGHSEVAITNLSSYNSRLAEYKAQQKLIVKQNNIGAGTAQNINKLITLDSSYEGLMKDQMLMNALINQAENETDETKKKDLEEAVSMISDRMLSTQAVNSYESGTTENLIKNYEQVATNENLAPEIRIETQNAIQKIKSYETIYNETRKYSNANDVFHIRTGIKLVEEARQKAFDELIFARNELLKEDSKIREADIEEKTQTQKDLESQIDAKKNKVLGLDNSLEKFKSHEKNLISREQQLSSKNINRFYEELTEIKSKLKTEAVKNKKEFNVFESEEYNKEFDNLVKKYKGRFINESDMKDIEKYRKEKIEDYQIAQRSQQRAVINAATNIQTEIANQTLSGNVNQEKEAAATVVSEQLSNQLESKEDVNDDFIEWGADPKMLSKNLSDSERELFQRATEAFYNATKDLIENPTIDDVVRFYGKKKGMKQAEMALDAIVQGWKIAKLPGYETMDTMQVFKRMFQDLDTISDELTAYLESYPQSAQTNEEVEQSTIIAKAAEKETIIKENTTEKSLDKNGTEVIEEDEIGVVEPYQKLNKRGATIGHKSLQVVQKPDGTYEAIGNDLNYGEYAPHMAKLLFPNHNNVGTVYTVRVADNFMDKEVKIFNEKGLPIGSMKFSDWMIKNNISPDSQEYRNKLPMVIVDSDNDVVGLIHDVSRISENKNTFQTIEDSKNNTIKIRNAVIARNGAKVKVTSKALGHDLKFYNEPLRIIDVDPSSGLAVALSDGLNYDKLKLGIVKPEDQIINAEHAKKIDKNGKLINLGALYELRRIGVTEEGLPKYFAFRANSSKYFEKDANGKITNTYYIEKDIQNGIVEIITQFVNRKENATSYSELMKNLFRLTDGDIDLRMSNSSDAFNLDKYLSQFVTVASVKGGETEQKKIENTIAEIVKRKGVNSAESHFIFTVNGKVVIGKAYVGNLIASIASVSKSDEAGFFEALNESIGKFRPNVNDRLLRKSHAIHILENGKWIKKADNYANYLKGSWTTSNVAAKITEKFNNVEETAYVSFVQQTMEVELVDDAEVTKDEYAEAIEKNEMTDAIADKIATKKVAGQELTSEEKQVEAINPKKVEDLVKQKSTKPEQFSVEKLYPYKGRSLTLSQIQDELAKEKSGLKYTESYIQRKKEEGEQGNDPVILTKAQKRKLQESQHTIDKLFQVHQRNIVEFIFNNVSAIARTENGKIKNIGEIKKYIRNIFNDYMENNRLQTVNTIEEKRELLKIFGPELVPDALDIIERSEQNLELINIVKKNWKVFEEEALLMSKKFNEIENKKTSAEPDGETEGEEENYEDVEDSNKHSFSKTAEEVNHKERVSAEVRVFCQGIKRKDASGNVITGIFGIPLYVGYDTVFDTVSALLADVPSDANYMKEMLEQHTKSHSWMSDFIENLFPQNKEKENKSLQNEVIRHMTKHALDMEFVMFQKNRNGTYSLKIYSTNSTAIIQNLKSRWESNINTSKLFDVVDGEYVFNDEKISEILTEYESLKGTEKRTTLGREMRQRIINAVNDLTDVQREKEKDENKKKDIHSESYFDDFVSGQVKVIELSHTAMGYFMNAIAEAGQGVKLTFEYNGKMYVASRDGNNTNKITLRLYEAQRPTEEALMNWLKNFGIEISDKTARQIITKRFIYDATHKVKFNEQWQGDKDGKGYSLLGVLAGTLREVQTKVKNAADEGKHVVYNEESVAGDMYSGKLLRQTIIDSLAKMESKHTEHRIVSSFYDNKKVLYGYTVTKFITDRINDLKGNRKGVEDNLRKTTYNSHAFWLDMLKYDDNFNEILLVKHLGITSLKEQGKKIYRNNALQELSLIDHELVKLGMFMPMQQGDVKFLSEEANKKYAGLKFRVARMFSPTMSDKSTSTVIRTNVLDFDNALNDLMTDNQKNGQPDAVTEFAFSQLVLPDLSRMIQHKNVVKSTNVNKYDTGAKLFYFLPTLNNLKIKKAGVDISFDILIENKTVEQVLEVTDDSGLTVKELMIKELLNYMEAERASKLEQWEKAGFLTKDDKGVYNGYKFLDYNYITSRYRAGTIDERIRIAAMDYTLNSMIANANSFMMIAGDPAQFYKKPSNEESTNPEDAVKSTFSNITKRLASQIAPGDKIADSDVEGTTYIQLQLDDVFRVSDNIKMIVKANDNKDISDEEIDRIKMKIQSGDKEIFNELELKYPNSTGKLSFFNIESTNAQEYTTWREHLYVLEKLGKTPNYSLDVTQEDINEARKIFIKETTWENLTQKQRSIVGKIMQPMKPVYTEQFYDKASDLMRFVYIKSSSFPLIPQLTAGMELDKLRIAMESIESNPKNDKKMTVRASFYSANKVGSVSRPLSIADIDGNFVDIHDDEKYSYETLMKSSLILPRSGFRIQQNVPYKSALTKEDITTLGTQTTKLLFGNGVMDMNDFEYNGIKNGSELQREYFRLFDALVSKARNDLYKELGIDPVTHITHEGIKSFYTKVGNILKKEAILRGFPKQDIKALGINPSTGNFEMPLWMSPNSAKFEALLTSIISHRISKIKFPGYSYVVGSENGFKVRNDEQFDVAKNGSQIVFTDTWDGKALKPNQAFVQSKFRVNGELVDLIKHGYAKQIDGKWMLDTDKIDIDLLQIPSFRIPTSKHSSMEKIEIAGFLPTSSADLIIVSRDGTVAMGEDYDIDKRYTYHLWTTVEDGKIIPLNKKRSYQKEEKLPLKVIDELIEDTKIEIANWSEHIKSFDLKNRMKDVFNNIAEAEEEGEDTDELRELLNQLLIDLKNKSENVDIPNLQEKLKDAYKRLRSLEKDKTKLIQNEIIKIHNIVFSHPEVKKLMVQKLSVDEAKKNAEFIEGLTTKNEKYFTPISDRYQQNALITGAVGRKGTAAYSLDVVGHSLFEQSHWNGNTLRLITRDKENKPINMKVRFGNVLSDGKLGQQTTLSEGNGTTVSRNGDRSISDVHSERQNLMVDNATEEIAVKVHLNNYTMSIDKLLNMLGFDKGNDGHNISFLFISQPIIKKYVEMMESKNSNTAEYELNRKQNIINQLLGEFADDTTEAEVYDAMMDNTRLTEEIIADNHKSAFQAAILKKFIELEKYGNYLISIQTAINIDSKGVGKNLFEVTEKIKAIQRLFLKIDENESVESANELKKSGFIENAGTLIGEYSFAESVNERDVMIRNGWIQIQKEVKDDSIEPRFHMIRPNTVAGTYAIHSLVAADRLWSKFFPYNNDSINSIFSEVTELIGNSDLSESKTIEIKKMIFDEMKKYLVTNRNLNYFSLSPQDERRRLFFDAKKGSKSSQQSLASFIKSIMDNKDPKFNPIKSNRLLNRLDFELNTNGKPSLVKLINGIGQNFDETYIYDSIIELIDENIPLGTFNGKEYNSIDLAQDLVLYAYMEGGVQQAIQFTKYIPVSYLKLLNLDKVLDPELGKISDMLGLDDKNVSTFSRQFMQHSPQLAKRATPEIMADKESFEVAEQTVPSDLSTLNKFRFTTLNSKNKQYPFVSIYNEKLPKGESKFQLYAYMEDEKGETLYVRIPVLGQFGMSEYSMGDRGIVSLINQPNHIYPMNTTPIQIESEEEPQQETTRLTRFNIQKGNIKDSIRIISQNDNLTGNLAKTLLEIISPSLTVKVALMGDKNGMYNRNTDTIILSQEMLDDMSVSDAFVATVIMREVIHSITDKAILSYAATNLKPGEDFRLVEKAPEHIKKLYSLFREAQRHLKANRNLDKYIENKFTVDENTSEQEAKDVYNITYGGKNIMEFIERMLSSPEFQEEMNKIKFKESDKTITQKFFEWLNSVFTDLANSLGIKNIDRDSITANALESIFEILKEKRAEYQINAETAARNTANQVNIELDAFGDAVNPDEVFNPSKKPLFDKNGAIDDEFYGYDPKVNRNLAAINASIAEMIDSGILKVKC